MHKEFVIWNLQVGFLLSGAHILYLICLWLKESYYCCCCIRNKSFPSIVKKFKGYFLMSICTLFASLYLLHSYSAISNPVLGIGALIVLVYMFMQEPTNVDVSTILECNDINVGSGAAQQYFYGYLKLLMSEEETSWQNRLQEYRQRQGVDVFPKLIILLPKSAKTKCLLLEENQTPDMRKADELKKLILYKCGIERKFSSTVYVIEETTRFVAEYASPLTVFCKMREFRTGYAFSEDAQKEQLMLFYQNLKDLIMQDADCRDTCLLLPYDVKPLE